MTVLVLITGVRHRITLIDAVDARLGYAVCSDDPIALIGSPPDPESAYQRAVYPLAFAPTWCSGCFR